LSRSGLTFVARLARSQGRNRGSESTETNHMADEVEMQELTPEERHRERIARSGW
jgi:hypothetical protein